MLVLDVDVLCRFHALASCVGGGVVLRWCVCVVSEKESQCKHLQFGIYSGEFIVNISNFATTVQFSKKEQQDVGPNHYLCHPLFLLQLCVLQTSWYASWSYVQAALDWHHVQAW